jgi:hypothetical protein
MRYRCSGVRAALFVVLLLLAGACRSQQSPCDPALSQLAQGPQGYRLRGNRCEGIYVQPVGSTTLLLASFTGSFEDFDPKSSDKLSVDWSSPGGSTIHLRAYGLHEKLYYQMDAVVPTSKTPFVWDVDLLDGLHLSREDIGVVGFTDYQIGAENKTLYLPLTIRQKSKPTFASSYQAVVIPGSELKELYVSLAKVGTDGRPQSFLISDKALGRSYYPAERGIPIEIPKPAEPGIYYLELGATGRYGNSATQQIWFYSAGGHP